MEATVKGVRYHEVPDTDEIGNCIGCAGDEKTGEGICYSLPSGCAGRAAQWRRVEVIKPTPAEAYEGVATSLAKQFDQPVPQVTLIIDETELRDLWKRAYVASLNGLYHARPLADKAVNDYRASREAGTI